MRSLAVLVALVGAAIANVCTNDQGYWSFEMATGVTDFDTRGVALNDNYFCFFGCLITETALQNYKVDLAQPPSSVKKFTDTKRSVAARRQQLLARSNGKVRDDDDPNQEFCPDDVLRQDVGDAISKATNNTATAIAQALLYNLNRPGWAIVVVQIGGGGFVMNSVYEDNNFCDYDAVRGSDFYNVKVAKIDMS